MSARGLSLLGPQIYLWLQLPCSFCLFLVSTLCFLANGPLLFISPRLHGHTVLDETQGSLLKETSPPALGKHRRKTISEHGFTNFLQNKLGKLCHQIVSIRIPGTSAHYMPCKSSGSLSLLKQQICTFCVAPNICNSAATKYISVASGLKSQSSLIVTGSIKPSSIALWGVLLLIQESTGGSVGGTIVRLRADRMGSSLCRRRNIWKHTVNVSENKNVSWELNSGKTKMKA